MDSASRDWWQRVLAGPDGSVRTVHDSTVQDSTVQDSTVQDSTVQGSAELGRGSTEGYAALPRPSDPRVLVDLDCPKAASDVLERMAESRTSKRTLSKVAGSLSPLLTRRKADWFVSSPASNGTSSGTLREHLCGVLNADVKLSISVGPPRPNRKPIVRCYLGNNMIAVAKLGPDDHTLAMVENEGRWLSGFMEDPLGDVVTPKLVHSGMYGTSALLIMEPLDLIADTGVEFSEMPMATLKEFIGERVQQGVSTIETQWWQSLEGRLGERQMQSLQPVFSKIRSSPFFDSLEVSAFHGDWSPWNTGRTTDGRLAIWDWERATLGVPTGFDLLHLHFQYGSGFTGATLELASLGIPTAHHQVLHALYLLEVFARHNEAEALDTPRHAKNIEAMQEVLDDWS